MATAKPFKTMPFPLGAIAPTQGTPLALTSNFTDLNNELAGVVTLRALGTNTGNVYLLNSSAAADLTNYLNVVEILAPGGFWSSATQGLNQFIASQFFIDVDNTGAKVVVTITQR